MSQKLLTLTGKVEKRGFGFGVWALVCADGAVYELQSPPSALCQLSGPVWIQGRILENVMTLAMIGPVLQVEAFGAGESP
jgi:hypothetical protein